MPARQLPERPSLDQYRKQAKERARVDGVALTQAQFAIAREHGFDSWPKFAKHIETLRIRREVASLTDPVAAFMKAATAPREAHASGTIEEAELILAALSGRGGRHDLHRGHSRGRTARPRIQLARSPSSVTVKAGPLDCDALTYLCFSPCLGLDKSRSATRLSGPREALLDAGASANTGWCAEPSI